MTTPLIPRRVNKVWGRRDIPAVFGPVRDEEEPVGEIWFERPDGADAELLVKFLFTSERLSIQVHPDDSAARASGLARGKDEAWLILSAEPDSTMALGTRRPLNETELREAAQDGSIVDLVDWRPVHGDDFIFSPAGTIHAIGAGLGLIEVQQSCDVTYRLYDYGRPRELHLEEGVAVARPEPFQPGQAPVELSPGRTILASGGSFVVERWSDVGTVGIAPQPGRPLWLIPLWGDSRIDGRHAGHGSAWMLESEAQLALADGQMLVAYPGAGVAEDLLAPR